MSLGAEPDAWTPLGQVAHGELGSSVMQTPLIPQGRPTEVLRVALRVRPGAHRYPNTHLIASQLRGGSCNPTCSQNLGFNGRT